jgi:thiol-disulfide isomerase/thioredoxin
MQRRRIWLAGAGLGAAALGLGVAWWRQRPASGTAHAVFQARFARPDGSELDMAAHLGRPLLLNFWATWCPPCVREMPLLDRFAVAQAAAGWRVVGLAVDAAAPVREFLRRQPVGFEIGMAGFDGVALSRSLGNEGGGLPFTAVFDREGLLRDRHVGEASQADLDRWAREITPN